MSEGYTFIKKLVDNNRLLLTLQEQVLSSKYYDENLYTTIENYVADYIKIELIDNSSPEKIYFNFIQAYNNDMKAFIKTGKYPLAINKNIALLSRFEYDIILLFSCLFTEHRFRIMQLINNQSSISNRGLFIGCGPGLEIELAKEYFENLYAYDISLNNFLITKHSKVHFKESYFTGDKNHTNFDVIYIIELLEHLSDPYTLIQNCQKVLSKRGKILLTTATNIPQFDHLYNFETSHKDFENKINNFGFSIIFKEDILHQNFTLDIGAKNRFYVLEKDIDC